MALSNWSMEQHEQNNTPLNNICHSTMITVKSLEKATGYYWLISISLGALGEPFLQDDLKLFQLIHEYPKWRLLAIMLTTMRPMQRRNLFFFFNVKLIS